VSAQAGLLDPEANNSMRQMLIVRPGTLVVWCIITLCGPGAFPVLQEEATCRRSVGSLVL
jgi:hypothetical protein